MSGPLAGQPVLVTGAAGFIGSHLVDALLETGARVRAMDNLSTGTLENLEHALDRIEFLETDIRSFEACRRACDGVTVVFHEAALGSVPRSLQDPATTFAVNVTGTANVFAAAREGGARRVVYASSSSVYGDSQILPKSEGQEGRPLSPYAVSKAVGEQIASSFFDCFGLQTIGLRYFNVYGPRQSPEGPYAAVVPRFIQASLAGEGPVVYGDGEQSRDFTYVADAVEANLLAAAAPAEAGGRADNLGGGRRTRIRELAEAVRDTVGAGAPPVLAPPRPGDVAHSLADLALVSERLGFSPRWELRRGLAESLPHFEKLRRGAAAGQIR